MSMKIFVSHSSKQKLFVRDLEKRLPGSVELWTDEKKILVGDAIDATLRASITAQCDLFLILIDDHAAKSPWVQQELAWALQREREIGRNFLLPIVLDKDAWREIAGDSLQQRRYLACLDFDESTLAALASNLTSDLFAWLCREREVAKDAEQASPLTALEHADDLAQQYANEIRRLVHPHRLENPLPANELAANLATRMEASAFSTAQLGSLMSRLRQTHLLEGVFFDGEVVYLSEERVAYKLAIFQNAKKKIARAAIRGIKPGSKLGIDGGSTTLELAKCLAEQVRARSLWDLQVFTNSLPAATVLLQALTDLGAGDRETACRVMIFGGWCRPISLTVVRPEHEQGAMQARQSQRSFEDLPENLDASFIGTNGIYRDEGFAVNHTYEVPAKQALLARAERRIILADPSKFLIQQAEPFASFADGLQIITCAVPDLEEAIERMRCLIKRTTSEMVVAP